MAVVWDAMGTLFDVSPVSGRYGEAAMPLLLHLALSLQATGRFVPFPELVVGVLGEEALELFASLEPYPEAREALGLLAEAGARSLIVTNGSRENTETLLARGGLDGLVAEVRSVEEVRAYKPAPEPYGLAPPGSTMVAAHDWDVFGARSAGLRAILVDRRGEGWRLPGEAPEIVGGLVAAARGAVAA